MNEWRSGYWAWWPFCWRSTLVRARRANRVLGRLLAAQTAELEGLRAKAAAWDGMKSEERRVKSEGMDFGERLRGFNPGPVWGNKPTTETRRHGEDG